MKKSEQFKHLLEYFVSHLEYVTNEDTHFVGYAQYIKPHIEADAFQAHGKGCRVSSAFNDVTIAKWRDFGDDHFVSFTVSNFGADRKNSFLHWLSDAWSIKANWEQDADADIWHVSSLLICYDNEEPEEEVSLEELGLFDGKAPNDALKKFWSCFAAKDDNNDLFKEVNNLLRYKKNVILTGAPGSGKTYFAQDVAGLYARNEDHEPEAFRIAQVQFHPSYDYTDFVEGLRPVSQANGQIGFARQDGIFKTFCKTALAHPDKRFVFIIDEINRGDINKIFGELFYAIDPDYRGPKGRIKTQYQNMVPKGDEFYEGFYVPANVYIIGTMNDIDRSVESMDFAFRRRFAWREVDPRENLEMLREKNLQLEQVIEPEDPTKQVELSDEEHKELVAKLKNASFFATVTAYCNNLNRAIRNEANLGNKYQIGASYFLNTLHFIDFEDGITEDQVEEALEQVWRIHLEPVLKEYLRGRSHKDIDHIVAKLKASYGTSSPEAE